MTSFFVILWLVVASWLMFEVAACIKEATDTRVASVPLLVVAMLLAMYAGYQACVIEG